MRAGSFIWMLAACAILAIVIIVFGVKVHRLNAKLASSQEQLTQSKSDATQAQTDLTKAKSQVADLQTQLDKAKGQQADLQVQLDKSKAQQTEIQAQLDRSKAQSTDLQAQLDKAKVQSADLQAQLNQATSGSSQLLTQLDQAKIQSMDLQSRLQKAEGEIAELQPLLLKARHMPVTTSLEKVHGGRSFTLHINNLNVQPLSVNVSITGPDKARSQTNIIGASATLNVEKLAPGETVVIASDGFDPVTLTAE